MNTAAGKKETGYLTLLRVTAAVAVVVLHTNGRFWNFSYEFWWRTANFLECVFYFAVPVFFMLSGATLLDYRDRYSTKEFFVKRFRKTVVPFLGWSLFALGYDALSGRIPLAEITGEYVVKGFIEGTLGEVYWFFPALFSVYLCFPLFSAVPEKLRKPVFTYIVVLGFLLNALLPLAVSVFCPAVTWPYTIGVAGGYLLYALTGYLLHHYDLPKRGRVLIYLAAAAGLLLHLFGTKYFSYAIRDIDQTFKGYNNAPCILYAVGVFVLLKQCGGKVMRSPLGRLVRFLEPYTFGIFLVHKFIQYELNKLHLVSTYSLAYSLGAPAVIIPISVAVLYLLRKIPYVRKLVP